MMADNIQLAQEITATVETTLGAIREMSKLPANLVAIPPLLSEFILDNGFRHDDTRVILAPGDVWLEGSR